MKHKCCRRQKKLFFRQLELEINSVETFFALLVRLFLSFFLAIAPPPSPQPPPPFAGHRRRRHHHHRHRRHRHHPRHSLGMTVNAMAVVVLTVHTKQTLSDCRTRRQFLGAAKVLVKVVSFILFYSPAKLSYAMVCLSYTLLSLFALRARFEIRNNHHLCCQKRN